MKPTSASTSTGPLHQDAAREVCLRIAAHTGELAAEAEFIEFIEHNTARITPRTLARLIGELPDLREKLPALDAAGLPQTRKQLAFLAEVVETFALQQPAHSDLPYAAALEAAFALQYFHRAIDLVPDSLGAVGYIDDAAVAAAVLARHAGTFEKLAAELRHDWSTLAP
jgi:uncharacterized membrane protein YkvA (DUF1232 family)